MTQVVTSEAVTGKGVTVSDGSAGLATGYTAIAAAKMARNYGLGLLTLLVPVSPADSLDLVEPFLDEVYCLIRQLSPPFAVAQYYQDFSELADDQVRAALRRNTEWSTGNSDVRE